MKWLTLICVLSILTYTAFAADDACFLVHQENGCDLIGGKGLTLQGAPSSPIDDPSVVWTYNVEWPIYTTTSNTADGYVFAGTYLNNPKEAELFPPGVGTPLWTYLGTEFDVDASDDGFILGAVDDFGGGVSVTKWAGPGTGTPDWTAYIANVYLSSYGPYVQVSRDGSTITALVTGDDGTRLLMYDPSSSTPLVDYMTMDSSFPRLLRLSSDGRYAAVRAGTYVLVYDRDLNLPRDEISLGYGSTPLAISGDGDQIAYGWTSLIVREWTGSSYQQLWSRVESGYHMGAVSISDDGSTL
ncbi:MAG: hypothetical protein ACYTEL_27240, partial [Planctomycetota bacterium]